MKLKQWLEKNNLRQRWLAQQLGLSDAQISLAFRLQREEGKALPFNWIPRIMEITNNEVSRYDDWPPGKKRSGPKKREKTANMQGVSKNATPSECGRGCAGPVDS